MAINIFTIIIIVLTLSTITITILFYKKIIKYNTEQLINCWGIYVCIVLFYLTIELVIPIEKNTKIINISNKVEQTISKSNIYLYTEDNTILIITDENIYNYIKNKGKYSVYKIRLYSSFNYPISTHYIITYGKKIKTFEIKQYLIVK